jgi:transcriptional regulator with XRE-family HTH domain
MPRWVFLPELLRAQRQRSGLTQRQLAQALDLASGSGTVEQWEAGDREPRLRSFLHLLYSLDCEISDLCIDLDAGRTDNEAPSRGLGADEEYQERAGVS